jgi:hypothetical protein
VAALAGGRFVVEQLTGRMRHFTFSHQSGHDPRLYLHGTLLYFRTAPRHLGAWLRRIDRWVAYANSIVEE